MPRFCTLLLLICIGSLAHGQKFQYAYYQGDGVPFKVVNQTVQDARGYVWLATDSGLFRFDGNTFEDYNIALRSKTIRAFLQWDNDTILFANDTGVHALAYQGNEPVVSNFLESTEKQYPTTLFKDSQGRLWVGQMDGTVWMQQGKDGAGQLLRPIATQKTEHIFFGEDAHGTLWALVPKRGIFYYNESTRKLALFKKTPDALHLLVTEDVLWLVGNNVQKWTLGKDRNVKNATTYTTNKTIKHIARTSSGTCYMATDTDIFSFSTTGGKARLKRVFGSNDPHRVEELPYESINHLAFTLNQMDLNHVLWVSANNGLCLMWSSFFQNVSGLGYDNVTGLYTTNNGQIFVSQGTVHSIRNSGNAVHFRKENQLNGIVGMVAKGPYVWYGTTMGHLYQYRGSQQVRTYDLSDRGSGLFFMSLDHVGNIWICQATSDKPLVGVAKLDPKGNLVEYGSEKGFESRILVVREGGRNELYAAGIGTSSYLYKYNAQKDMFENKSLPIPFEVSDNFEVHDIAVTENGIVWMATTDGLLKYDTETVRRIGLGAYTNGEVRSVCAMPNGAIWLATDTYGLIQLDPDGNYVVFDEKSGTPSRVASYRCLSLDSNLQLWVGTAEGLVYSSQSLPGPVETKPPELRAVTVNTSVVPNDRPLALTEQDQLKLEMTTVTFPSEEVDYQFKAIAQGTPKDEIVDIPWVLSRSPELLLEDILPGSYQIWVRAQKEGGYAWSKPAKIEVRIHKKWYKTWWGTLLLGLFGFLFFWYFVRRWSLKRIRDLQALLNQKQYELKQKERELASSSRAIKNKKQELYSAGKKIHLLQHVIGQLPKNATWDHVLPVLKKLVYLPTGIDAVEVAFKKEGDIHYYGYLRGNDMQKMRQLEFNEKKDLASLAMVSDNAITMGNYSSEATDYISEKSSGEYASLLMQPFVQAKGALAVFCLYSKEEDAFLENDLAFVRILTSFLSVNVINELG